MVSIRAQEDMKLNYQKHQKEILNSKHRYAVVETIKISYFDTFDEVEETYPLLGEKGKSLFGTKPWLIDIGKATNSLEYQKERLGHQINKFESDLVKILDQGDFLAKEEKKIKN